VHSIPPLGRSIARLEPNRCSATRISGFIISCPINRQDRSGQRAKRPILNSDDAHAIAIALRRRVSVIESYCIQHSGRVMPPPNTSDRSTNWWLIGCLLVASCAGCSREWYRTQADAEVAATIIEKSQEPADVSIEVPPDSRLYDPYDPDAPPMPPDDPASHEFMHDVDGLGGFEGWHRNGDASHVDAETWLAALPRNEAGNVVLNLNDAVRVARLNSRDYQDEREDLYLSALGVTFERFRFDAQFFAGNSTASEFRRNNGDSSTLTTASGIGFSQLGATGGVFVAELANSIMWQFSNGQVDTVGSTLDFSLVQPLLRFGGRARVLEQLTQRERTLLANVRQMEQFRQGFYVNIVTGRNSGSGPSPGGAVGQAGLGLVAGTPSGRTGASDAGGYLGLLQDQQQIRNQASNIAALRDSLAQLQASFDANRIKSRLQIDQARQALLNGQSSLLSANAAYQTRLDGYKIQLGLPPDIELSAQDPLLERFNLIDPQLTELQNDLSPVLGEIRKQRETATAESMNESLTKLLTLRGRVDSQLARASADFESLQPKIEPRRKNLRRVRDEVERTGADIEPRVYDDVAFGQRIELLRKRLPSLTKGLKENRKTLNNMRVVLSDEDAEAPWKQLSGVATRLSDLLLELSLFQAETRLEGIVLVPVELQANDGIKVARENRLDWMNARANLVDVWRQIEFRANELESDLDLVVSGQLGTAGDNPVDFQSKNSRLRFGLEFDSPITRLAERNRYRESLINYQRARRDYLLFEDRLKQSVRNTVRVVDLSQLNFEVRRAAVHVAITQVDIARIKLNPPLQAGQVKSSSPTAARDLVSALSDLLDAQNDFLNVWVNYEVLRMLIDFELGKMQLDEEGIWIDPGMIETPIEAPPEETQEDAAAQAISTKKPVIRQAAGWRPSRP
jgi:hypothetical protein